VKKIFGLIAAIFGKKADADADATEGNNSDVVILDDPLSALDAEVGKHVFDHCVRGMLMDAGKTVIMATNAQHTTIPPTDGIQGQIKYAHPANPVASVSGNTRPRRNPNRLTAKSLAHPPRSIPGNPHANTPVTIAAPVMASTCCTSDKYVGNHVIKNAQPTLMLNCANEINQSDRLVKQNHSTGKIGNRSSDGFGSAAALLCGGSIHCRSPSFTHACSLGVSRTTHQYSTATNTPTMPYSINTQRQLPVATISNVEIVGANIPPNRPPKLTHELAAARCCNGNHLRITPPEAGYAPACATPHASLANKIPTSPMTHPVAAVISDQPTMYRVNIRRAPQRSLAHPAGI
jgi:hypothetical protein